MPPLARYPAFANPCAGCGGAINFTRAASMFEYVCNWLLNPRTDEFPDRVPRPGTYEDRLEIVHQVHSQLRGVYPGWGRIDINIIIRTYDQALAESDLEYA